MIKPIFATCIFSAFIAFVVPSFAQDASSPASAAAIVTAKAQPSVEAREGYIIGYLINADMLCASRIGDNNVADLKRLAHFVADANGFDNRHTAAFKSAFSDGKIDQLHDFARNSAIFCADAIALFRVME
jgi:hypothetical protein